MPVRPKRTPPRHGSLRSPSQRRRRDRSVGEPLPRQVDLMVGLLSILFVVPLEVAAIIWAWRRSGFMPHPHGFMLYLVAGQIVMALHANHVIEYSFVRIFSTYAYIYHFDAMFGLMAAMLFSLILCVPNSKVSIREQVKSIRVSETFLYLTVVGMLVFEAIYASIIRWDIVWYNSTYLQMTSEDVLRSPNALYRTLQQMFALAGLAAVGMAVFVLSVRKWALGAILVPIAMWHVVYSVAAHSRVATLYIGIAAILTFLLTRNRILPIILGISALFVTSSVLWGRITNFHGLSSLSMFWVNIKNYFDVIGFELIGNLFEGMFVTSEYFSRTFLYAGVYKNLSLSPLLSFIDGFDSIRELYEIKLQYWVPNSAVSEILSFGTGYAIIFFGTQLVAGRLSARLMSTRPGLVALLVNSYIFFSSIQQFTYSTRTVYRSFVYTIIACIILGWLKKRDRPAEVA
jgi:hypothetical protein